VATRATGYGLGVVASVPEWERLTVLAPVFVVGIGLVIAVLILLVRAGIDGWRDSQHKRLILASLVGLVFVVVILTYLGVSIPKEE
jgi:hypothetical protein